MSYLSPVLVSLSYLALWRTTYACTCSPDIFLPFFACHPTLGAYNNLPSPSSPIIIPFLTLVTPPRPTLAGSLGVPQVFENLNPFRVVYTCNLVIPVPRAALCLLQGFYFFYLAQFSVQQSAVNTKAMFAPFTRRASQSIPDVWSHNLDWE